MQTLPMLDSWYMVELTDLVIMGKVTDHDYFFDNSFITTAPIVNIDSSTKVVTTTKGTYKLGEPDLIWWRTRHK